MTVEVNYLAVIVAAVANMALGFVWYGPLFGKVWMQLSGRTMQDIDAQKSKTNVNVGYGIAFVGSLVMAFVLSHAIIFASAYLGVSGLNAGLQAGLWNWLGFIAPVTLGTVLWDGKPWKLWFLTNGYYLLSLLMMGSIIAVWM